MTTSNPKLNQAVSDLDAIYLSLESQGNFVAREAQVQLSGYVAESVITSVPLIAEAPTGTGKTLAYLIGVLAGKDALGDASPVLIATATKALQHQLLENDIPRLARTGLIDPAEVAIVKGKGNYFCVQGAEYAAQVLEQATFDGELFVDDSVSNLDPSEVDHMLKEFKAGQWNGDFDSYEGPKPKTVIGISVNSDTCTRKKCPSYNSCAYFKARAHLSEAKIVVANHDLLLLDLESSAAGSESALSVANYHLVVDEAHHLPDKAIKVGSTEARLTGLAASLPKLGGVQQLISSTAELKAVANPADFDRSSAMSALRELLAVLHAQKMPADSPQLRFARGVVPEDVCIALKALQAPLDALALSINMLLSATKEREKFSSKAQDKVVEVSRRLLDVKRITDETSACLRALLAGVRVVKWLEVTQNETTLCTAPLDGSEVLTRLLWKACGSGLRCKSASLVSATLRDLGGFERYSRKAGVPSKARSVALPYTFPYGESTLTVAPITATPKPAERQLFLKEVERLLPSLINPKEATLILFPSWTMLKDMAPKLRQLFGAAAVRVQGEQVTPLLVKSHCAAVDANKPAILAGVATLSEGLDLPGHYCSHVIILALPFSVPTSPVEQELSEILGAKYFSERSLPDAMIRLTQMVGRLLRRESDRGRITICDRRLASTSYGQKMLQNLPPFKKVIAPLPRA